MTLERGGAVVWLHRRPLVSLVLLALAVIVADPAIGAVATPADAVARASPRVALTFDDGWSQSNCRSIARMLRAHDVDATFFINSMYLVRDPAAWRTILSGFEVANHTSGHRDLTQCSAADIRGRIRSAEQQTEAILGRQMTKALRPPYGACNDRVRAIAKELGYRIVLWNVSSADTSPSATVSRVIRNASQGHDGAIVLMHCGPDVTPRALDAIVHHYRGAGFRFVTVGRMLGIGT